MKAGITLDWETQAREAWNVTKRHLTRTAGMKNLHHRKNAAYAWRQTVFYVALSTPEQAAAFVDDETLTQGLSPRAAARAAAILLGLRETIETGAPANGPFLGWVARSDRPEQQSGLTDLPIGPEVQPARVRAVQPLAASCETPSKMKPPQAVAPSSLRQG